MNRTKPSKSIFHFKELADKAAFLLVVIIDVIEGVYDPLGERSDRRELVK